MIGMELVRDRLTKEPAKEETAEIFEKMRGIIIIPTHIHIHIHMHYVYIHSIHPFISLSIYSYIQAAYLHTVHTITIIYRTYISYVSDIHYIHIIIKFNQTFGCSFLCFVYFIV